MCIVYQIYMNDLLIKRSEGSFYVSSRTYFLCVIPSTNDLFFYIILLLPVIFIKKLPSIPSTSFKCEKFKKLTEN